MKRYLLFAYDTFYPGGGASDVIGDYDSLDGAMERISKSAGWDYYEILDMEDRCWLELNPKTGAWEENGDR